MEIGNSFLINRFTEAVWMMKPDRLRTLTQVLLSKFNNLEDFTKSLNLIQVEDRKNFSINTQIVGTTAILNVEGVLVPKCSWLDAMCGFTSTLELNAKFNDLVEDRSIQRIVLYFDSPGGESTGIFEFAESVFNARGTKEIITFTDVEFCSAAYHIGAASSKIIVTPSSCIGSIGTYIGLVKYDTVTDGETGDRLNFTFVQAGDNKLFGSPYVPLTDEERNYFQEKADFNYNIFVGNVARYRGVSKQDVMDTKASYYEAANAPEWMYDILADYQYLFDN